MSLILNAPMLNVSLGNAPMLNVPLVNAPMLNVQY